MADFTSTDSLIVRITPNKDTNLPSVTDGNGTPEDIGPALTEHHTAREARRLREEMEAYVAGGEGFKPDEKVDPDPSDPFGIRILKDVGRGVMEAPVQVVGGAMDAGKNILGTLDSVGDWLNTNVADLRVSVPGLPEEWGNPIKGAETGMEQLAPAEAETVTGGMFRGVAQFVTGFIPMLKAVKGLQGGTASTAMGRLGQTELAAAPTAALVFDPHENRLSNLIEEFPELSNPVTRYLQAEEGDSEAEGRFKNAIEGFGLGVAGEGFVRALKAVRANRRAKGIQGKAKLAQPEERIATHLGDEAADPVTTKAAADGKRGKVKSIPREELDKAVDDYMAGRIPATALPFEMNWARASSSMEVENATASIAKLFASRIDKARRGKITDEELMKLAEKVGMSPEDLLARRPGGTFKAEEVLAARFILESSAEMLHRTARAAQDSTDEALLYSLRRMVEIHVGLQAQFQGAASEAGRALRAFQLPVGSKEAQLQHMTEILVSEGGSDHLRRLAKAIAEVNDLDTLDKVIAGSRGKRTADMLVEAWYFSLLSGPQTHAVNVLSSAMKTAYRIPERALAARIAELRGTESVQVGEAGQMYYGLIQSLPGAFKASYRAFVDNSPSNILGKVETGQRAAISAKNFGADKIPGTAGKVIATALDMMGEVARMPTRAIMAQDEFIKYVTKNMQVNALAYRQATSEGLDGDAFAARVLELQQNPPRDFLEDALDLAQGNTWTSPLGPVGRSIQQASNVAPWNIPAKLALPFIRTPVNLMKDTMTFTPLGMLRGQVRNEIAAGSAKGDMYLAQMAIGSLLSLTFADQVLKGNVTGHGPTDPDMAATWKELKQPYSITLDNGKTWYSYNRTDPFGLFLGAISSYAEIFGQMTNEDRDQLAATIATATSRSVFSKTWMRGPNDILDALTQPERYANDYISRQLGTFLVPTGSAQIARNVDPVWREVYDLIDVIKSRTPGYSAELPPWRNRWGFPQHIEGGLGPDIISPIYRKDGKYSPIDEWMFENKAPIKNVPKIYNGVELDPWQYDRLRALAGNEVKDPSTGLGAYDTMNAIIEGNHKYSSVWERSTGGPDGGKATIMNTILGAFNKMAWEQLKEEDIDVRRRARAVQEEGARAMKETIMNPNAGQLP